MTPEEYDILVEVYADAKLRFRASCHNGEQGEYALGQVVGISDLAVKLLSEPNKYWEFAADSRRRMIEMEKEI